MEKRTIDSERWIIEGKERRVALMHFYVKIVEKPHIIKLYVYKDCKVVLTLDFLSVEQAVRFTNDVINNVWEVEEIQELYNDYLKDYDWINEINYICSKAEEIKDYSNSNLAYYRMIKQEYLFASSLLDTVLKDETKSEEEKKNYYKYVMNLKSSYETLKSSLEDLTKELFDLTEGVENKLVINKSKNNRIKTRKLAKKKIAKNSNK